MGGRGGRGRGSVRKAWCLPPVGDPGASSITGPLPTDTLDIVPLIEKSVLFFVTNSQSKKIQYIHLQQPSACPPARPQHSLPAPAVRHERFGIWTRRPQTAARQSLWRHPPTREPRTFHARPVSRLQSALSIRRPIITRPTAIPTIHSSHHCPPPEANASAAVWPRARGLRGPGTQHTHPTHAPRCRRRPTAGKAPVTVRHAHGEAVR